MIGIPPQERLPEESPLINVIGGFFTEAYARQMEGDDTLYRFIGLGDKAAEAIALNPKNYQSGGDNLRFILGGGGLAFEGFSIDGEAVKYSIYKITLPPENKRPIGELFAEEINLTTPYLISEDGRIINREPLPGREEARLLTSALEMCELAPEVPEWIKEIDE